MKSRLRVLQSFKKASFDIQRRIQSNINWKASKLKLEMLCTDGVVQKVQVYFMWRGKKAKLSSFIHVRSELTQKVTRLCIYFTSRFFSRCDKESLFASRMGTKQWFSFPIHLKPRSKKRERKKKGDAWFSSGEWERVKEGCVENAMQEKVAKRGHITSFFFLLFFYVQKEEGFTLT